MLIKLVWVQVFRNVRCLTFFHTLLVIHGS